MKTQIFQNIKRFVSAFRTRLVLRPLQISPKNIFWAIRYKHRKEKYPMRARSSSLIFVYIGCALLLTALTVSVANAFPPSNVYWLSIKNPVNGNFGLDYYDSLRASGFVVPNSLSQFQSEYNFLPSLGCSIQGANFVTACYYNDTDLALGREMHCREQKKANGIDTDYIACFVVNHGLGAGAPAELSLDDTLTNRQEGILATVAMVYDPDKVSNKVSFYIFDKPGNESKLITEVALDSQTGYDYLPHLCLNCHGGDYKDDHSVSGASFLPFDLQAFRFNEQDGLTKEARQELFRQLNAIVYLTNPPDPIKHLIERWYNRCGGVEAVGCAQDTDKNNIRAPGYNTDDGNSNDEDLYDQIVGPYCRSCHIAQDNPNLEDPQDVLRALGNVFGFPPFATMPHAEKTNHNFWSSTAPQILADNRKWSLVVNTRKDEIIGGCDPSHCSLREAIIDSNKNTSGKHIITFDVDCTSPCVFMITKGGTREDKAATGDLDITENLIILGDGANQTIIDGGGLDRVFHILTKPHGSKTEVVIQGVTIQGGLLAGDYGSGIFNNGSKLTLNFSVVSNNILGYGGGLAALNNAETEINQSTIASNLAINGGGISNIGSTLMINNSTIGKNSAGISGGGIYNSDLNENDSRVEIKNSTIARNQPGSGIYSLGGMIELQNNIIAGNTGLPDTTDCFLFEVDLLSFGYNLVGQNGNAGGCDFANDQNDPVDFILSGSIDSVIAAELKTYNQLKSENDPDIGPLFGALIFYNLVPGGPAMDQIPANTNPNCIFPSYDQLNQARPLNSNRSFTPTPACDIGAVEFWIPR